MNTMTEGIRGSSQLCLAQGEEEQEDEDGAVFDKDASPACRLLRLGARIRLGSIVQGYF